MLKTEENIIVNPVIIGISLLLAGSELREASSDPELLIDDLCIYSGACLVGLSVCMVVLGIIIAIARPDQY